MDKNTLLSYQPNYYSNSQVMENINDANANELTSLNGILVDLSNQFYVSTVTTALERWEKQFGIKINTSLTLAARRNRILAKLRGRGTSTVEMIKDVAKSFIDDREVDLIEHNEDYYFEIALKSNVGFSCELTVLYDSIESIKPAHLAYSITLQYLINILIIRSFKKWFSDTIPLCGTIDCSYNPYVSTDGRSNSTTVYAEIIKGISDEFIKASEQTMIPGNGKRLVENLELVITDFVADEVLKVSEELYLTGATGKSLENIINDNLKSFLSDELLRTTGTDFKGLESIINTQFNKLYSDILEKAAENNYVEEE